MSVLGDAILSGKVGELIVNEFNVMLSTIMYNSAVREVERKKAKEQHIETQEEVNEEPITKAEIVEYKKILDEADSILNVKFNTIDDQATGKLSEDEMNNTLDTIIENTLNRSQLNLDDEDSLKHIKKIVATALVADNKVNLEDVFKTGNSFGIINRDDLIEVNTIYRFLTGQKLFASESCVQLNEFVTAQLLFDTISVIAETNDWGLEANIAEMLAKTKKRLERELATNGKLTGEDSVDPVVPINFNQGILNAAFNQREPKMKKTTEEYIKDHIMSILPADWVNDNQIRLEIKHSIDIYDNNRDTGLAEMTVFVHGVPSGNTFIIDLDSVSGNGYCIRTLAFVNNQYYKFYVNIEKFPEIVNKIIMSNGRFLLNNPNDPESIIMFNEVSKDVMSPAIIYNYDLSGMSKHFALMTNEEKAVFANNLMALTNANWYHMGPNEHMYRMRVRKYDSPDKFTLVSDCKTRQQEIDMLSVIAGNYKRYFKDVDIDDSAILVVKYNEGKIDVSYNGKALKDMYIPSETLKFYKDINENILNNNQKKPSNKKKDENPVEPKVQPAPVQQPINPVLDQFGNIRPEFMPNQNPYPNVGYQFGNPIFNNFNPGEMV